MSESLKGRLQEDMKTSMKSGQKERLATIRLIMAAIKQREVDERIMLDDTQVLLVLEKMVKQRRESINQYQAAGRDDLVAQEAAEVAVIQEYLPAQLSEAEIAAEVKAVMAETGASSVKDMGKVMGLLKSRLQGRADMALVGELVKAALAAG